MSKKTKKLEKENLQLTRKQDATNRNVLQMAEERTKQDKEMRTLQKKNERLEKLCRGMQAQGRGGAANANAQSGGGATASYGPEDVMGFEGEGDADEGATDSEYDEYEDDEEVGSEEYDEDTEEEALDGVNGPRAYGPVPPPPPPPPTTVKGQVHGQINGQKGTAKKSVVW